MQNPKKIKPYSKVKKGDMAYENPIAGGQWDNTVGRVLWVGTAEQLRQSKYAKLEKDWEDCDPENYDLIVIDEYDYGPTLFNYNNDPSGCVCFENS